LVDRGGNGVTCYPGHASDKAACVQRVAALSEHVHRG
jgi:hypothetical protein